VASTTWVARESGRLERCGLGVHGAGNQALWHQRRVLHPGGEPADVASPCARMAASNF